MQQQDGKQQLFLKAHLIASYLDLVDVCCVAATCAAGKTSYGSKARQAALVRTELHD
jgi:hypothetical protein